MQSFFFKFSQILLEHYFFRKTAFFKSHVDDVHSGIQVVALNLQYIVVDIFISSNYLSIDIRYSCRYNWCFSAYFHPYFVVSRIWSQNKIDICICQIFGRRCYRSLTKEDPWQYKHEALQIPGWSQ